MIFLERNEFQDELDQGITFSSELFTMFIRLSNVPLKNKFINVIIKTHLFLLICFLQVFLLKLMSENESWITTIIIQDKVREEYLQEILVEKEWKPLSKHVTKRFTDGPAFSSKSTGNTFSFKQASCLWVQLLRVFTSLTCGHISGKSLVEERDTILSTLYLLRNT